VRRCLETFVSWEVGVKDENKTKEQLVGELAEMRQRVAAMQDRLQLLEAAEAGRKQAEESLRFTQYAIDQAADAAFWMGSDARFVYVNDAACQSLGYSREELLAKTVHDISPDFPPEVWANHWQEVKERKAFTIETRYYTKDGQIAPVEVTVNFVEFGGKEYNCAFVRDVTERKRMEEALYGERTWLETLYEISRRLNIAHDEDELLRVLANPAIEARAVYANLMYITQGETGELEQVEIIATWQQAGRTYPSVSAGEQYYLPEFPTVRQWMSYPNEPLLITDVTQDEQLDENISQALVELGLRALVIIPLIQSGHVAGLINFCWDQPHEFSEYEIEIYCIMINLASSAVQNRRLMDSLEQMVAERTAQLGTASDIAAQVNAILDPDELLNTVISLLKERFGLYYVHVYMLDEEAEELRLRAGYGEPGRIMLRQGWKVPLDQKPSLVAEAVRTRQIAAIDDVAQAGDYRPNPLLPDVKSEVAVPLIVPSPTGDQVLGVFAVQHDRAYYFTPAHLDVFSALAGQIATALQNAALFEEIQTRFYVSQALIGADTKDEVLDVLIQLTDIYPQSGVSIHLIDQEAEELALIVSRSAAFESGIPLVQKGVRFTAEEYPLLRLVTPEEPFVTPNVLLDKRADPASQAFARQSGIVSAALYPLTARGEWMGILAVMSKKEGYFDKRQRLFYQTLADQGATVLQTGYLRAEIQESEERFRRLSNATMEGIVIHDQGLVLDANQALATMFGYESPEELIGTNVYETLVTETVDGVREEHLVYDGVYEGIGVRKDGSTFPLEQEASFVSYRGREVRVVATRDITERKQAEEALRESEVKHRLLLNSIRSPVVALNRDMTVLYCNGIYAELVGKTAAELTGQNLSASLLKQSRVAFREVLATDEVRHVEGKLGERHWHTRIYPTPWGLLAISEDVTERVQAEEALRESEGKLRSLVDQSVDGIILVDEQGYVIEWNQGQEQIIGLKKSETLGRPYWDIMFQMFPTGRHAPVVYEQIKASFQRFLKTGQAPWLSRLREQEIQRPDDGTRRIIQQVSFPIRTNKGFMTGNFTRDITVQVQAIEALRRRNHELALLSRMSRELTVTLNLRQVTGWLLQEIREAIGAEGTSVWLWDERDGEEDQDGWLVCQNALHPVLSRPVTGLRLRPGQGIASLVAQTGESAIVPSAPDDPFFSHDIDAQTGFRTVSLLVVPLRVRSRVIGVLEVVNKREGEFSTDDLSLVETLAASAAIAIDNARLMEALQRRTAELQARNEELDAYAHTVAHDLKGPLGHMVGFAQVLEQDHAELSFEELKRCSQTIARGGRKMSNIIDELLLMAGIRDAEVELEPLDMAHIVREVQIRLAYMIDKYQAEVLLPPEDAWPVALGHAAWVEEVWVNYLSNALKYGGEPPHVELGFDTNPAAPERQEKGKMIGFWVRDDGSGLTPEEQSRLFTPFTRFEQTRAKGHGLGLSIVQRIVGKFGGQVWVESEVGVGSTFWFTLPAQV
jgi:PAS domain S-box-containing protein